MVNGKTQDGLNSFPIQSIVYSLSSEIWRLASLTVFYTSQWLHVFFVHGFLDLGVCS